MVIIRAGGTGTRLWPLSTAQLPKQFVPVLSERTLLQETFQRVRDFGIENIFVTVNARHASLVREQIPELRETHVIAEPLKRNTGPAIAYETAALRAAGIALDTIVASIPADDFVGNASSFGAAVRAIAHELSARGATVVLPVVTPTSIDSGYSYVRVSFADAEHAPIADWIEKPDVLACRQMVESGDWFAHTGMYFWKLSTAITAFEQLAPEVWHTVLAVQDAMARDDAETAAARSATLPIISIESLITKKYSDKLAWRADEWQWSDVGKWPIVKQLLAGDERRNSATHKDVHFVDAENNLVYAAPGRRVVCIGVSDLVIVENGEHLLVCRADRSHEIGPISEQLGNV